MYFLDSIIITLVLIGLIRTIETDLLDKNRKKGKIYANWTLIALSVNYGIMILSTILEYGLIGRQINLIISGIAIGIMTIRFSIKYWAFKSLGEYWSANIEIRERHQLIKTGPYKYLRHPAYLSNLLDFIAVPLFANSYFTILWILPVQIFLLYIRIYFEEKKLIENFGEEYIKYKQETFGVIPLPPILKSKVIRL